MSNLLKELQEAHRESPSWRLFGLCHQAATRIAALEAQLEVAMEQCRRLEALVEPHIKWDDALEATPAPMVTEADQLSAVKHAIMWSIPDEAVGLIRKGNGLDYVARAALTAIQEAGK